jgi:hypothetical protein
MVFPHSRLLFRQYSPIFGIHSLTPLRPGWKGAGVSHLLRAVLAKAKRHANPKRRARKCPKWMAGRGCAAASIVSAASYHDVVPSMFEQNWLSPLRKHMVDLCIWIAGAARPVSAGSKARRPDGPGEMHPAAVARNSCKSFAHRSPESLVF